MKGRILFVLIIFLIPGCISFRIGVPEDPGSALGYFIITDSLNLNHDAESKPADSRVSVESGIIYSVIKVMDTEEKMEVRWRWYSPDGVAVRESPPAIVNEGAEYLEYFVFWDSIENSVFRDTRGTWTVTVHVNGKFFSGRKFTVY